MNNRKDSNGVTGGDFRTLVLVLKILGPLGVAGAVSLLGYAAYSVFNGRIHWVTKNADFFAVKADQPTMFWLCVGFFVVGGVFTMWCGIRLVRETWR